MEEFRSRQVGSYSIGFIMEVVREVKSGRISMSRAQRKYGIGGNNTIPQWIEKFGKLESKKKKEIDVVSKLELEVARLKEEKQELESALAQAHLRLLSLESLVEVYEEDKVKAEKKSTGKEESKEALRKAVGMEKTTAKK